MNNKYYVTSSFLATRVSDPDPIFKFLSILIWIRFFPASDLDQDSSTWCNYIARIPNPHAKNCMQKALKLTLNI